MPITKHSIRNPQDEEKLTPFGGRPDLRERSLINGKGLNLYGIEIK